jgi:hypothetical protein
MSHLMRCIAIVLLSWSVRARAHDNPPGSQPGVTYVQVPVTQPQYVPVQPPAGQAPIIQVPVVQNSIVNAPGYRDGRHRPRGSIVGFGFRGLFAGALTGLGASYFVAREAREPERMVALSTSIGALSGAGLGLTLGVLDRMDYAGAYFISRDLTYGVLFGAAVGALSGGIVALSNHDAESVLIGACAGSLAGLGLGLLTGIIEGHWHARHDPRYLSRGRVSVSLARVAPDSRAWGARLAGSF